ncbi:MAG: large repetitive protein [Myxococcales bacterium]|nr:large repetitive protein [Myxococcales bacterium]
MVRIVPVGACGRIAALLCLANGLGLVSGLGCTKAEFALDAQTDADANTDGESDAEPPPGEGPDGESGVDGMTEVPDGGDIVDVVDVADLAGEEPVADKDAGTPADEVPDETNGDTAGGAMPTVLGQIVVTELMNDPNVLADAYGEWFEIYNPGDSDTFDLNGCEITDAAAGHHTISRCLLVPPKSFATLAIHEKRTAASPFGVPFDPDYVYTGVRFGNTHADGVHLTCAGVIIATFDYGVPDPAMSGHSFSVDPAHYQQSDNQAIGHWCAATDPYDSDPQMIVKDYGTPGRTNPSCK